MSVPLKLNVELLNATHPFFYGLLAYHLFLPDASSYFMAFFWLSINSYALLMALFFILGRPIYRMSDRFKIDADVEMELDGVARLFKTVDISEQGLCFVSDFPYLN